MPPLDHGITYVQIALIYHHETPNAYLLEHPVLKEKTWVAKSLIDGDLELGIDKDQPDLVLATVVRWLARAKGWL